MTLIIVFGPPAVGKMTVGLELEKLTGFRVFHNHLTAELVLSLFPLDSPVYRRLVEEFRHRIFEEYVKTDAHGLIFTFVWVLDDPQDKAFVERTSELFTRDGGHVCFVELTADLQERVRRNETPLRLSEKRPQRDLAGSQAFLQQAEETYQMNSSGSFYYPDRHLKIDNTRLEPAVVARHIARHFSLLPD